MAVLCDIHLVVVNSHVHLPSEVVREVELVGGVTHGELVKPAVAQADGGLGGHDLEGGVLGLVGEQAVLLELRLRHVLDALEHVRGGGVLQGRDNRARCFQESEQQADSLLQFVASLLSIFDCAPLYTQTYIHTKFPPKCKSKANQ